MRTDSKSDSLSMTVLMRRVLDVMVTDEAKSWTTRELASRICENGRDGLFPGANSLAAPLSGLRRRKWLKKTKVTVGERHFGYGTYPIIERRYDLLPGKAEAWRKFLMEERKAQGFPRESEPEVYVPPKERFFAVSLIHDRENLGVPYMLRLWIGRLRFHIFYRGDLDEDCHDHPWDFKTFPLTSYVEEVIYPIGGVPGDPSKTQFQKVLQVVPAWRWSYRKAEHRHRVLGRYAGYVELAARAPSKHIHRLKLNGEDARNIVRGDKGWYPVVTSGKIVTIVWRGHYRRQWGFWKNRLGKWCWQQYRKYIWEGGKSAPCDD